MADHIDINDCLIIDIKRKWFMFQIFSYHILYLEDGNITFRDNAALKTIYLQLTTLKIKYSSNF